VVRVDRVVLMVAVRGKIGKKKRRRKKRRRKKRRRKKRRKEGK
jgi:hypothetical protein